MFTIEARTASTLGPAIDVPENMPLLAGPEVQAPKLHFTMRFNELSLLVDLPHTVTPDANNPVVDFQIASMNSDLSKMVLARLDIQVSERWNWKLFRHTDGYVIQMPIGSQQASIFFLGFTENEVLEALASYRKEYASESDIGRSSIAYSFSRISILPAAQASEAIKITGDRTKVVDTLAEVDRYNFAFGSDLRKCLEAGNKGFNAATVDPFLQAGRGLSSRKNFAIAWSNTIQQTKSIWEWMDRFQADKEFKRLGRSFWNKPNSEKSLLFCNFILGSAAGGLATKLTTNTLTSKLSAVKIRPTTPKSVKQLAPVPAGVVKVGELKTLVSRSQAPKHVFIKDAPIVGYQIKSARFEDIPQQIRKHLGAIDQTQYTPQYLEKNIGSVIAMQMKGDVPDFYIIGKDTFQQKYQTVLMSEVSKKNAKYFSQVSSYIPEPSANGAQAVAVLKKAPVQMVKMSDVGFKVNAPATIESPWGLQTKPKGADAYLVFDEGKDQFYMVNADATGNPLSYIPAGN